MVLPYVLSEASFVIVMDVKDTVFEGHPDISLAVLAGVVGSFQMTIYSIAINFVYRFFALEREGRLRYFQGKTLIFWMLAPVNIALLSMIVVYLLGPNDYMTELLKQNLKENFDLDIEKTVYFGCKYWRYDENGEKFFNWKYAPGILILNVFNIIPMFFIVIFGWKSSRKIKNLVSHGESEYSRRLQVQLYKALVAQTLLPLVFLFFPVAVYFVCPLIGISIQRGSISFVFLCALYPALDPIPIICMVDDYRNAFLNFFRRLFSKNEVTSVTPYERNSDRF